MIHVGFDGQTAFREAVARRYGPGLSTERDRNGQFAEPRVREMYEGWCLAFGDLYGRNGGYGTTVGGLIARLLRHDPDLPTFVPAENRGGEPGEYVYEMAGACHTLDTREVPVAQNGWFTDRATKVVGVRIDASRATKNSMRFWKERLTKR